MNAQEFAQYMPPSILVDAIAHVWNSGDEGDEVAEVLRTCWAALVANAGEHAATRDVWARLHDQASMRDLMEVVS